MAIITVLGVAQDGGRPQPGCNRPCCSQLTASDQRSPVSLGIQTEKGTNILIEATRDLGRQLRIFGASRIDRVFLTHAHLGHVDGLGLFGRETMGCKGIYLHCSKSMEALIQSTPAWSLLLKQGVFKIIDDGEHHATNVNVDEIMIEAIPIVHRSELSDMHAFIIRGKESSLLFLPDHDSWIETLAQHKCHNIRLFLSKFNIDIALIDGTFWSADELQGRDMNEVPHPTVQESIQRLGLRQSNDAEIYFIHLNHTNPLNIVTSEEYRTVINLGWNITFEGQKFII